MILIFICLPDLCYSDMMSLSSSSSFQDGMEYLIQICQASPITNVDEMEIRYHSDQTGENEQRGIIHYIGKDDRENEQ